VLDVTIILEQAFARTIIAVSRHFRCSVAPLSLSAIFLFLWGDTVSLRVPMKRRVRVINLNTGLMHSRHSGGASVTPWPRFLVPPAWDFAVLYTLGMLESSRRLHLAPRGLVSSSKLAPSIKCSLLTHRLGLDW